MAIFCIITSILIYILFLYYLYIIIYHVFISFLRHNLDKLLKKDNTANKLI